MASPAYKRSRMARRTVPSGRHQGTGAEKEGAGTSLLVLVFSRRHDAVPIWGAGAHRSTAVDVLPSGSRRGFRERAVHHDPGAVRMADPVGALVVGESFGLHGVRPSFQRPVPQVLPKATRADVGERRTAAVPDAGVSDSADTCCPGTRCRTSRPRWALRYQRRFPSSAVPFCCSCAEAKTLPAAP